MKKLYFLIFTILISAASFGQVIIAEDFTYPDGSLVANSAWETADGVAEDLLVSSGQAVVQHGTPSEDAKLSFNAVTGNIYAAFDFSVDDLGAPFTGSDSEYFAHLGFNARIDIENPTAAGDYTIGISTNTSTAQATWATDLTYGQTYRIVVKYDQVGGVADLWLNPANEMDTSISGGVDTTPGTITSFDLRQSDSSENETVRVDDLMVGQTFNDVLVFAAQTNPSITLTSPSSSTVFNPGTTSVNLTWTTANLTGNEFVNVIVNMGTPSSVAPTATPFAISTTDGTTYNVTLELRDAGNMLLDSDMTSFSVATLNTATDIAALRAGAIGDFYELSGEAIISYIVTENTRNQKYIQDGTAGILIDDSAGTLSTSFNIGDGITGLKGTLGQFGGVLQFVPTENVATASSTGNTITPEVVTLADFVASGENYESELIQINALSFSDIGSFADNTNYAVTSGMDASTVRVAFGDEDLIGTGIPTVPGFVIGLGGEFNGTYQIQPRYYADVENAVLSNNDFETREFSIYPNPTNTGSVNITSVNATPIAVTIFDILGKQVKNATISNNRLDVSNLKSGIYLLRLTQDGATSTKKLVIR